MWRAPRRPGTRRRREVDGIGLRVERWQQEPRREPTDRRGDRRRHTQRRLPAGLGQPFDDHSELRARAPHRGRHLEARSVRTSSRPPRGCAAGRSVWRGAARGLAPPHDRGSGRARQRQPPPGGRCDCHPTPGRPAELPRRRGPRTGSAGIEPPGATTSGPPVTISWRETELATWRTRWMPRTALSTGSMSRAMLTLSTNRRIAFGRSTVTVSVPGRRSPSALGVRRRRLRRRGGGPVSDAAAVPGHCGSSSSSPSRRIPPTPSVSTWWARRYSAARPCSSPSISERSHGERSGSNGIASSRPTRSSTWRIEPGAATESDRT